uniref:Uncharacterized protein n=1 Tax=Candidatus Kentrum sp. FM TaxID=2126340 RepID=A0A450VR95_9GAMM|nr:MAG: hypothetical protein BECKFM1743A_GA0114220_1003510 [Candidatus Kentron sp. FM]VFJ49535.1 MAG: hypothetical protein BECKFM1743C_GA0114222_100722 [Candidatus Kentron sp. FM]VFK07285.1 MAG: hypothetical protein BECKFM1743B_GA0114221_1003611 [Candidatus Kentron sp. FM]
MVQPGNTADNIIAGLGWPRSQVGYGSGGGPAAWSRLARIQAYIKEHRTQYESFLSELVLEEIGFGDASAAQRRLRIVENVPILETTGNAVELS